MSFFGKMFGGKKEEVKTTGEAIQKLRETEEMLLKKQVNIYVLLCGKVLEFKG